MILQLYFIHFRLLNSFLNFYILKCLNASNHLHVLFYYPPPIFPIPIKDTPLFPLFPALTDLTSAQRAACQTVSFRAEQL